MAALKDAGRGEDVEPAPAPVEERFFSFVDGALAGVALCPEPIPPSEWLPLVLGDAPFPDREAAARATEEVMELYDEVAEEIEDDAYEPLLWFDENDEPVGADWAGGFVAAAALRQNTWAMLGGSDRHGELLVPMIALAADEDELSELFGEVDRERIRSRATNELAESVFGIKAFWARRARRGSHTASPPKVGRNASCPCGSGKKFKKCCGA